MSGGMRRRVSVLRVIYAKFLSIMLVGSAAATVLLLIRYISSGTPRFVFLLWNLFLAWIPAVVAVWFTKERRRTPRLITVLLFAVWLAFLPNTFYILSDFIHLSPRGDVSILFDVVLLFSFTSVGFLLGLASLGVMHLWLKRYLNGRLAASVISELKWMP